MIIDGQRQRESQRARKQATLGRSKCKGGPEERSKKKQRERQEKEEAAKKKAEEERIADEAAKKKAEEERIAADAAKKKEEEERLAAEAEKERLALLCRVLSRSADPEVRRWAAFSQLRGEQRRSAAGSMAKRYINVTGGAFGCRSIATASMELERAGFTGAAGILSGVPGPLMRATHGRQSWRIAYAHEHAVDI